MKKIFVCEFITCGGIRDSDLSHALIEDAETMLQALLGDLRNMDCLEILTCRDSRMPALKESVFSIEENDDAWVHWEKYMRSADLAWIIAPETGGILARLVQLARDCGCFTIACEQDAIQLVSSKFATFERLASRGVPSPETRRANDTLLHSDTGWVIKPDDGAGSDGCYIFNDGESLRDWLNKVERKDRFIQQRYITGVYASLSAIFHAGEPVLLSANRQVATRQGNTLNNEVLMRDDLHEYHDEFEQLLRVVHSTIPGLRGYVGIDLVINENGAMILDINPRLTTSYAGLSGLLNRNIAEFIIFTLCGEDLSNVTEKATMSHASG